MKMHLDPNLTAVATVSSIVKGELAGTFVVKGTFDLSPDGSMVHAPEPDLPSGEVPIVEDEPTRGVRYPSDFVPMKPRADVLLVGSAKAGARRTAGALKVRLRVGPIDKSLHVFGDRQRRAGLLRTTVGEPAPFELMPLTYEHAAGGKGYPANPVGRHPSDPVAPNVEDPSHPLPDRGGRVEPAGFGPLPGAWNPRKLMVGTYDAQWFKQRWPWLPLDFDYAYFNAAPRDQQVDGYLKGDEVVSLHHLVGEHEVYETRLPGVRPRCFLLEVVAPGRNAFREVTLKLDTVWIDADAARCILVWRGLTKVRTLKLKEFEHLVVAAERLGDEPRAAEAYRAALEKELAAMEPRPDPAAAAQAAAHEKELQESRAALEREEAAFRAEFDTLLEEEQARVAAHADGPSAFARSKASRPVTQPPAQPEGSPGPAPPVAELRAQFEAAKKTSPNPTGPWPGGRRPAPPPPVVPDALNDDHWADIEQIDKDLTAAEAAHEASVLKDAPPTPEQVRAAAARGESQAGRSFARFDFVGADLSGADFRGANLRGAKLASARLARANFTGADLSGADLSKADLTGATLDRADLTGASVDGAVWPGSSWNGAILAGVDISRTDWTRCAAADADFSEATIDGARFAGAKLDGAGFAGTRGEGIDFRGASLRTARFMGARIPGVRMCGCDLTNLRAGDGAAFPGGDFTATSAAGSVWDGADLTSANFSGATLPRARFNEARLGDATFDRVDAPSASFEEAFLKGARLTNANFLRANFERADLTRASFEGSNVFDSGFWDATFVDTIVRRANLKRTLLG